MEIDKDIVKNTAEDYSKYINNTELDKKLKPINKSIDDMLARLQEFETMYSFVQPDITDSTDILKSIIEYKPEFDDMCEKIDSLEFLTAHIKSNLICSRQKLKREKQRWVLQTDATTKVTEKVTNIFTPLFKKNNEKKPTPSSISMELFQTEDYFK